MPGRMRTLSKPSHSSPSASWVTHFGVVLPVGAADVAQAVAERGVERRLELGREQVDLGLGEVGQAAGVVEVEVGGDDLADVGGAEAERFELPQRRRPLARLGIHHQAEGAAELTWLAGVLDPEPGVDEHQPVAGLDRQAVADDVGPLQPAALAVDQPPPVRAERPAVEVMHPHPGAECSAASRPFAVCPPERYKQRTRAIVPLAPEWRNWQYAIDSKSIARKGLWVRVPPPACARLTPVAARPGSAGRRRRSPRRSRAGAPPRRASPG